MTRIGSSIDKFANLIIHPLDKSFSTKKKVGAVALTCFTAVISVFIVPAFCLIWSSARKSNRANPTVVKVVNVYSYATDGSNGTSSKSTSKSKSSSESSLSSINDDFKPKKNFDDQTIMDELQQSLKDLLKFRINTIVENQDSYANWLTQVARFRSFIKQKDLTQGLLQFVSMKEKMDAIIAGESVEKQKELNAIFLPFYEKCRPLVHSFLDRKFDELPLDEAERLASFLDVDDRDHIWLKIIEKHLKPDGAGIEKAQELKEKMFAASRQEASLKIADAYLERNELDKAYEVLRGLRGAFPDNFYTIGAKIAKAFIAAGNFEKAEGIISQSPVKEKSEIQIALFNKYLELGGDHLTKAGKLLDKEELKSFKAGMIHDLFYKYKENNDLDNAIELLNKLDDESSLDLLESLYLEAFKSVYANKKDGLELKLEQVCQKILNLISDDARRSLFAKMAIDKYCKLVPLREKELEIAEGMARVQLQPNDRKEEVFKIARAYQNLNIDAKLEPLKQLLINEADIDAFSKEFLKS